MNDSGYESDHEWENATSARIEVSSLVQKSPSTGSAPWSTICGSPTPRSSCLSASPMEVVPLQLPELKTNFPIDARGRIGDVDPTPRIERAAMATVDRPRGISGSRREATTPASSRLYEFRYPPMPRYNSVYKEAKKAEYDGDYEKAMTLYLRAMEVNDRADSAMKDYAGILHMRGRTGEAISFLEQRGDKFKSSLGYKNLLSQLKAFLQSADAEKRNLPRYVYVAIVEGIRTKLSYTSLPSIFPNYLKIASIVFINPLLDDNGSPQALRAIIEFASHSAARKALMVVKHNSIKCQWLPDGLIDSDDRILKMTVADVSLEAIGPTVSVFYAIVPESVINTDWIIKLTSRHSGFTEGESNPSPSRATTDSALTLPIIAREDSPPGTPLREKGKSHLELDIGSIESTVESSRLAMDWCLNTPSPIRHVALLF